METNRIQALCSRASLIMAFSTICFLGTVSVAETKSKPKEPKTETMPVTAAFPAARSFYEDAMGNLENLRVDEALKNLRAAIQRDPKFALAHAWLFFSTPDPAEESVERARAKALMVHITQPEQLMIRWMAAVHENNYVGGITAMNDLVAQFPRDKRLCYLTGRWVMAQQQYEHSQRLMLRALAVDPNYPAALNELGYTYARMGDYEKAMPVMEKYAASLPSEPNPQDSYAEIMRLAGYFQGALLHYREALKIDPRFYQAQAGIADTYSLMGDQETARAEFQKAIDAAQSDSSKVDYTLRIGLTYVREKKFEDADRVYTEAAEKAHAAGLLVWEARAHRTMAMYQPDPELAMQQLGAAEAVLTRKNDVSQSSVDAERARILRVRIERASAVNNVGMVNSALDELQALAKADTDPVVQRSYHAATGLVLVAKEKFAEAVPHLEDDSYDPLSLKLLLTAYTKIGALDEAKELRNKLIGWNVPSIEQALVVPDFRIQERTEVAAHRSR